MAVLNIRLRSKEDVEEQRERIKTARHARVMAERGAVIAERGAEVAEREAEVEERKQTAAEEMADVTKELNTAQARYMDAMSVNLLDKTIDAAHAALMNEQVFGSRQKREQDLARFEFIRESMKSEDPKIRDLARDAFMGITSGITYRDQLETMRLQLETQSAVFDQKLGLMDAENKRLQTAIQGIDLGIGFSKILPDIIGKPAFDAGVKAMGEMLGFTAPEKKPVGKRQRMTGVGVSLSGTAPTMAAPEMTLEQAIESFKTGQIGIEDLIAAWPSLEEVIDKSLLVPSTAPTAPQAGESFEQDLIKRLQQ